MNKEIVFSKIVEFAAQLGIEIQVVDRLDCTCFLPNVFIQDTEKILVTEKCSIGDLLHEFSHIVTFPKRYRHFLKCSKKGQLKISKAFELILESLPVEDHSFPSDLIYYNDLLVGGYSCLVCSDIGIPNEHCLDFAITDNSSLLYHHSLKDALRCMKTRRPDSSMLTQLYYGEWIKTKAGDKLLKLTC